VTAATDKGQVVPDKLLKHLRMRVRGGTLTASYGDYTFLEGTLAIDPGPSAKTFDLKSTGGQHAGKTLKGIYELNRDTLKVCLAEPAGPRPEKFASTAENRASLLVCEREKSAAWLAQWIYDKKEREQPRNATVPDARIFSRTMVTTDSVEKVCEYYQTVLDANKLVYKLGDEKNGFKGDSGSCGLTITGKGGFSGGGAAEQNVNMAAAATLARARNLDIKELKLDPDLHLYTVAVSDPFAAGKEEAKRTATQGVITQDTKDYTVTLVITRVKGDTQTHIVTTFVVR
jgi:uncharacterized protein (TIGR03067 family)